MNKSPIKISFKSEIFSILLILASCAASIYFYLHFPDRVPTHWGINGEPNGWSSKSFGAFFLPVLLLGMYLMFFILPYIDPKRENYSKFANVYGIFKNLILGLLFAVYIMASLNGIGIKVDISTWVPLLIGIMFVVLGSYMGKLKLNWFVGARNMWTLSSESVWEKTNQLSGKVFIFAGILIALEVFMPQFLIMPTFFVAIFAILLIPNFYSFVLYNREARKKK